MRLKYIKEPDLNLIADLQKGWQICDNGVKIRIENTLGFNKFEYESLEDFNKEWATLKEPLLQGKLRESLKSWAEYQGVKKLTYTKSSNYNYSWFSFEDKQSHLFIDYEINTKLFNLENNKEYTLEDLVGK